MKGFFITFEGPDGSGKTTQIRLLEQYCKDKGYEVVLTREPGGTPISEAIRSLLLDPSHKEMDGVTEALLYAASRAQHVAEKIRPALEKGCVVLCDRFMDSSIAYQGYARGLGDDVRVINEFAVQGTQPDITFFMDLPAAAGKARVAAARDLDRLEQEDLSFHNAVYEGYLQLAQIYPQRYVRIDASRSIEQVASEIRERFDEYVQRRNEQE
ncbi:MAG: dTMP kinase [Firmicutes bacterium]|nr:dTMP kinase [Bacillota bacterium]